ncbi:hypothetical protein AMTR_s00144p00086170 [Amborella trichopoda]|uniref:Uncharacterized protein n=1 Tax=Amborella trichopoda TaxID=13333 RepID=W1P7X2_AMBTC|nr:hypothetical protein AMTR_s00144p00086170 [Amborella trichopoda]
MLGLGLSTRLRPGPSTQEMRRGRVLVDDIYTVESKKEKEEWVLEGGYGGSCWVPHPRTGIYYPKGHEKVMEDVPYGASTFEKTYWLRSHEGLDEPF